MTRLWQSPRMGGHRVWSWIGIGVLLAIFGIIILWPLGELVTAALAQGLGVVRELATTETVSALENSVIASLLATILALAIGLGMALVVFGLSERSRTWWFTIAMLPLFIPPFVDAFAWLEAYTQGGLSSQLMHWSFSWLYGFWGVVILLAVHTAPLALLSFYAALGRIRGHAYNAARIFGATGTRAFFTAVWPHIRSIIPSIGGLVFIFCIGDFGIPLVLGLPGHFLMVTTDIYQDLSYAAIPGSFTQALSLSLSLAIFAVAAIVIQRIVGTQETTLAAVGAHPWSSNLSSRASKIGVGAVVGYLLFVLVFPFLSLMLTALVRAYGLVATAPRNWTLANFTALIRGSVGLAILHSVLLAAAAATALAILGVVLSEVIRNYVRLAIVQSVIWIPYTVPGSVIGITMILTFNRWFYGTFFIIFLAYLAKFWGLMDPLIAFRRDVPKSLERAARIFGAKAGRTYWTAVWPWMSSLTGSLWLLVFINALYELTMSSLLYTPRTETLAVVVLNAQQQGNVTTTAAVGTLIALLMMAGAVLINVGSRRLRASSKESEVVG